MNYDLLKSKIMNRQAVVGVIGLGYVGLPLAVEMAKAGYKVIGIDLSKEKVKQLQVGKSFILDVSDKELQQVAANGNFEATTDYARVGEMDTISICVPTPLRKTKDPDITYITAAVRGIKEHMKKGTLIILESTTYPGTTEELVRAELEECGLEVGVDFFLCFSPERVDPGNKHYNTKNTPKIIGGTTPQCSRLASMLYENVLESVVTVSSTKVAETVKLLENTFRAVNIALVNEMALMCDRMGIDVWEVIDAAATKPFGFMKFTPGPGIGGHCIPIDPMYLSWKAKTYDFYNKFIELASDTNGNMPRYVVNKVSDALNLQRKCINGSRILLLGVAYKKDINDLRDSPGLELFRLLQEKGARTDFHDPFVDRFLDESTGDYVYGVGLDHIQEYDLVLLVTDHSSLDYRWIAANAQLVLDTRNAFAGIESSNIIKIGAPLPEYPQASLMETEAAATKED
ncbi:MAG: nucleotide sugar dehydrogenase [Limnochordia bacterium]|nr:nucleotide sugar dehydrogenase [Limnochordia bacterium]